MSRALKTPRDWLTGWSAATWQQCIVCLRFSPFRATFAQRGHRRRELPRLADDMTAISEGMKPCVHVRVRLFCRYFGNRPKNLTYVLGYVKLLDRARGKSAHCDTEVRDRFGHVFCEVTGDLTAGDLLGVALSPGAADDDLDVDLFAEPDGYVAGQRQPQNFTVARVLLWRSAGRQLCRGFEAGGRRRRRVSCGDAGSFIPGVVTPFLGSRGHRGLWVRVWRGPC